MEIIGKIAQKIKSNGWLGILDNAASKLMCFARVCYCRFMYSLSFESIGSNFRLRGCKYINVGKAARIMDGCWIEAVSEYDGVTFEPKILIGNYFSVSNHLHIAAINQIIIGNNCLIGSGVTIIDHNHGNYEDNKWLIHSPAQRVLYSSGGIEIGDNCWIADKVVILPNTTIGEDSVIGAGAIVQGKIPPRSIIYGSKSNVVRSVQHEI